MIARIYKKSTPYNIKPDDFPMLEKFMKVTDLFLDVRADECLPKKNITIKTKQNKKLIFPCYKHRILISLLFVLDYVEHQPYKPLWTTCY